MPREHIDYEALRLKIFRHVAATAESRPSQIAKALGVTRQAVYRAWEGAAKDRRPTPVDLRRPILPPPPPVPKECRDTVRPQRAS